MIELITHTPLKSTYRCNGCRAEINIETDDPDYAEVKRIELEVEHEHCTKQLSPHR